MVVTTYCFLVLFHLSRDDLRQKSSEFHSMIFVSNLAFFLEETEKEIVNYIESVINLWTRQFFETHFDLLNRD
jgi:hypothetical protein